MYSDKQNVLQLTSLMLKADLTDVVVCPGSRNAPIVHNFKEAGFNCYEITDERSAGFFALGLIEAKSHPVAVCCTSGSAVLNLSPAVAEAYYHPLPLLVITADRPQAWIGQMDGQTMPQNFAFGPLVRQSVCLPDFPEEKTDDKWYCNRLINEAFITLKKYGGPVHINVPISDPLFMFSTPSLPEERLIEYTRTERELSILSSLQLSNECKDVKRLMIVVGQMPHAEAKHISAELKQLAAKGAVIMAEKLSNLAPAKITSYNFDNVIGTCTDSKALIPDMVISIGGHVVSKNLKKFLRTVHPKIHWHISPYGEIADTYCCATRLVEIHPAMFLHRFVSIRMSLDKQYRELWKQLSDQIEKETIKVIEGSFTDASVIQDITKDLNPVWHIQAANSSTVRNLQLFPGNGNVVMCNRGINGIEGCLSTAVGYMSAGKPTLLIIGDLSFFYDRNGLWNNFTDRQKKETEKAISGAPLRILLINNGCGQIFHSLPGLSASPHLSRYIAAEHCTTAKHIAAEGNFAYISASNIQEFRNNKTKFLCSNKKVAIFEIFTNRTDNENIRRELHESLQASLQALSVR